MKNFLKNIWNLFKQWFVRAETFIQDNVSVAVTVTEKVKQFVDNPIGDMLITVVDDTFHTDIGEKIKAILPDILISLQAIDECKGLSQEDTLKCIAAKIQLLSDDIKNTTYHNIATLLAVRLSDGKIDLSDAIAVVEYYYQTYVKKAA